MKTERLIIMILCCVVVLVSLVGCKKSEPQKGQSASKATIQEQAMITDTKFTTTSAPDTQRPAADTGGHSQTPEASPLIPTRFCGTWTRVLEPSEAEAMQERHIKIEREYFAIAPDSIVWYRMAEGKEIIHPDSVKVTQQGNALVFSANKATSYIVFGAPGRAASMGRTTVTVSVGGDTLLVSIAQTRSEDDYARGTIVVTVPPEEQRYVKDQ